MKEEDVRYAFYYFLNNNEKGKLLVRKVYKVDEKNQQASQEYYETHQDTSEFNQNLFKNVIIEYLKKFYGKNPSDFDSKTYQILSEKFNNVLASNPQSGQKVREILETGNIDINDFDKGGILENIYPHEMQELYSDGMYYDDVPLIYLGKNGAGVTINARVYINPSSQYYYHLLNYIYTESIKRELVINTKTRYGHPQGDSLIVYVASNQLGLFLNLLNDYERENPEKISSFNNAPLLLERNSHNWYGYGHECFGTTLNEDVEVMFNRYIIPVLFLENFSKIFPPDKIKGITEKISLLMGNKEIGNYLEFSFSRKKIIHDILEFKEKISNGVKNSHGMVKEDIAFLYSNGVGNLEISKKFCALFGVIMKDPEIRDAFNNYFRKPENFKMATEDAMYLSGHYCEQIEFLGGGSIYSSKYLIEEKNRNAKIVFDFLQLMNSKQYCYDKDDIAYFNEEFNDFIKKVGGLRQIIMALDYCKGVEALNSEILSLAEQQIDRLYDKMEKNDEFEEEHHIKR